MPEKYDFCGYATKNDILCSDGRTIRKDAFKDCDGFTVPLVWQHRHDGPGNVLGHAILENRNDGVYTYGVFNETEAGKNAKELVRHGDVKALSIYANRLVQKGNDVLHGMIREVSLCLAGANPGARIEDLSFEHCDNEDEEFEALLFNGENIEMMHSEEETSAEVEESKEEEPVNEDVKNEEIAHAEAAEKTVKDVWDSFTEEQKQVAYYLIGEALASAEGEKKEEAAEEEEKEMAHNLFEGDTATNALTHAELDRALNVVIADAKKYGSLKDSYEHHMTAEDGVLAHATDADGMTIPDVNTSTYRTNVGYGVNGIEYLFPEARTMGDPEFIKRDTDWVSVVLNGVHKTPWSRLKSVFANITEDDARAKGFMKGNPKKNEFFSLMKRTTVPQTIYKKQKMDRDDIVDITDFNVVAWIKSEMRLMLNEELARAILVGDGRLVTDDDKISEEHIRPIVSDASLFSIKAPVTAGATDEATAKNFMKAAVKARKDYKGSGNPTLFTTEEVLTNMLLIEDGLNRPMYRSEAEVATAMRVKNIVTVPVMEGLKDANNKNIMGIIVNLTDYNVGADKGGEINMFDDFNIDYNQYIYLIETRCSGALTKPYSAIVLYENSSSTTTETT